MATLTRENNFRVTLGGESARVDVLRSALSVTQKIHDAMVNVPAGATGTLVTLWQSAAHGVQTNPLPEQFSWGMILVDPDSGGAAVLPLDIELASTRNNSTTVTVMNQILRCDRNRAVELPNSLTGADITNIGTVASPGTAFDHFTRIRARNPNASQDLLVRVVLFK